MAIAEDASTPAVTHRAFGSSLSAVSSSFSPPAGAVVVLAVTWLSPGGYTLGLGVTDSNGNTYSQGALVPNVRGVTCGLWWHRYATAPGAVTVTAAATLTSMNSVLLAPRVLTGCAASQPGNSAGSSVDGEVALITSEHGSWAYAAAGNPTASGAPTPNEVTTTLDYFDDAGATGCQAAAGRLTTAMGVEGKIWLGWRNRMAASCALEILPSGGVIGTGGEPPPFWQENQVLSDSDCNNWLTPDSTYKISATTINSDASVNPDPDLTMAVLANANYSLRMAVHYDGPTAGGFQWQFTSLPSGSELYYTAQYNNSSGLAISSHANGDNVSAAITAGVGAELPVYIEGMLLMGSAAGTLTFSWAQATSNSGATSTDTGSYLMLWRFG